MAYIHKTILGSGKPHVLIHGLGFDSRVWSEFSEVLARHYQVILIDLPGYGKSDPIDHEENILNITNTLLPHLPSKASYIGWSLGGLISAQIAIQYPESVEKVTNIASSPYFSCGHEWRGLSHDQYDSMTKSIIENKIKALNNFLLWQVNYQKNLYKKLFSTIDTQVSTKTLIHGIEILRNTDLRSKLPKISSIKYINGKNDPIILSNQGINSVLIENASHVPFASHLQEVLNHVYD